MSKVLLIYDYIDKWGVSAQDVAQFLIDNKDEDIEVRINSYGGDVNEAVAIYNNLRTTPNCTIYVDGIAASAAAIIALCGKPLKMNSISQLMLHSASSWIDGNKKDAEEQMARLDAIDRQLAGMIAGKMGSTEDDIYAKYFDGEDHYLSAKECADMGFAEIVEFNADNRVRPQAAYAAWRTKKGINKNDNNDMDIKLFQNIGAFKDCANEQQVVDKVNAIIADHAKNAAELATKTAELDKLKGEYKAVMDKVVADQEAEDRKIIEDAVADGRIKDEMKSVYENLMATDRENAHKIIASLEKPAVKDVNDFIKNEKGESKESAWNKKIAEYKQARAK